MPIGTIIRSKRRTLYLEVTKDGNLIVRAPYRLSESLILQAVEKHRDWIDRQQKYVRENVKSAKGKKYLPGESFLYLGEKYPLSEASSPEAPLCFDGKQFHLGKNHFQDAPELFFEWYQQAAIKLIKERVAIASAAAGISYRKIRITRARKRWGSCNANGNINFACRLIMAPLDVIDAVVMHELVHIKVWNHSRRFWSKLLDLVPDYKQYQRWLKDNQDLLGF